MRNYFIAAFPNEYKKYSRYEKRNRTCEWFVVIANATIIGIVIAWIGAIAWFFINKQWEAEKENFWRRIVSERKAGPNSGYIIRFIEKSLTDSHGFLIKSKLLQQNLAL